MNETVEAIIKQYHFNLLYAGALVIDLSNEQMTCVPAAGLLNHPAFTLGHLVTGSAMVAEDLGNATTLPGGWAELFQRKGPNDQTRPAEDAAKYPEKALLIAELERQHNAVISGLRDTTPERLRKPAMWRFSLYMPTLLDVVMFMCISHEQMHLGQLAAWRRAMNLPAALGTL